MLRRQASEKCVSTRQKLLFTGDTVTVTLKSSNIFVSNIPLTWQFPLPPKLHNSQFLHRLTMAFIMQQWLLQNWRQAPVVWHSPPLLAAFWRNLDKCRDQCCIINVNVRQTKQTFHRAQGLFHACSNNSCTSTCYFPLLVTLKLLISLINSLSLLILSVWITFLLSCFKSLFGRISQDLKVQFCLTQPL